MTLEEQMKDMGRKARRAATVLAVMSSEQKNKALEMIALSLEAHSDEILRANHQDLLNATQNNLTVAMVDRLKLNEVRLCTIIDSVRQVACLPDPVGQVMDEWTRPNGLHISRVRTPLGVIGIIYESRPNVTIDASTLCLKAGNAAILRGGSDSFHSAHALHCALVKGLKKAGFPKDAIQMVATKDRGAVGEMLKGLDGAIDVIVPRGGKNLVARVQVDARVPIFAHLEGLCHIYIDQSADLDMARNIVLNAKLRRTGICSAVETVLIDRQALEKFLPILTALQKKGCEIRATEDIVFLMPDAKLAFEEDWSHEYLDAIVSVKTVESVEGAIAHIKRYSSGHTESIIAEDMEIVEKFFNHLDSAILLHNASTQFADGGEFGFGAEIGIATGKMHARGPIGVEQLTSFQYHIKGNGQVRP
ncbi:glutamate-5-semialdehyde dehydrogenase [Bartonella henselae]|uniref:glutamate-5-semialdehyde dehydrogenase n=1 Tax=Bartonella henselae TaxID=38323 RepID=UPI0003DFB450|nr:glutamate-5-semialdehyde dehydrogenase [Bartonella henselae]ETS07521.1 gamma-glutamyl phosphate reductase [Bartonella henselae JK 42]ETS16324.1 gamma-glutamyl phosphate reductase [Bartonella henselae JK 41]KEC57816.1 gamma-glutamyl phosphate reductase [Bartonella henselae str. Zeus]KEC62862.1 gamma-glutamyl phosphate reductase [Bartonella henselae JK 53]MDM9983485.1 glutamate-5-semialdehyde dehydrogenase [Bartonella henselae]